MAHFSAGVEGASPLVFPWQARIVAMNEIPSDVVGLTRVADVSRRGLMMSAAAASAAGYTLAAGPVRAEVVVTDTEGIEAGTTSVEVAGGGMMPAYFARPKGVAYPPVVLVAMEIFGLHEYIRDVVRRVAKLGAMAIAPDLGTSNNIDFRVDRYW